MAAPLESLGVSAAWAGVIAAAIGAVGAVAGTLLGKSWDWWRAKSERAADLIKRAAEVDLAARNDLYKATADLLQTFRMERKELMERIDNCEADKGKVWGKLEKCERESARLALRVSTLESRAT